MSNIKLLMFDDLPLVGGLEEHMEYDFTNSFDGQTPPSEEEIRINLNKAKDTQRTFRQERKRS